MQKDKVYENCVICKRVTNTKKEKNINDRIFYVKGVGELCETCFHEIFYMKKNKDD